MRIKITPKEPLHIRVRYNGTQVLDQELQVQTYDIEVDHPKCCGVAVLYRVMDDGSEKPLSSANYGVCCCE
jgi:hypothetical protein